MFENINNLHSERAELMAKAEALCNTAIASKKDLGGKELEQYNSHLAQIKNLDVQIARHAELSRHIVTPEEARAARMPFFPSANAAVTSGGAGLKSRLREVYNGATMEQREQINVLAAYLRGDLRAAADMKPSGDGGYVIPSFVVPAMERDYAAFAPVVSVARLWPLKRPRIPSFPSSATRKVQSNWTRQQLPGPMPPSLETLRLPTSPAPCPASARASTGSACTGE